MTVLDTRPAAALPGERALAPDLGRGLMLLAIALAHAHLLLYNADYRPTPADQAAVFVRELLVDDRARPMFFFLFGYGLVQLTTRLASRGNDWAATRPLLRRRGRWLVLIGLAHSAIIGVDIISVYGFALVCFAGLLVRSDRALLWIAAAAAAAMAAFFSALSASELPDLMSFDPDVGSTDLGQMVSWRFAGWVFVVVAFGWQVLPAMLLGVWAARRRLLESPGLHLTALRRTAIGGIGLALAGGLPWALIASLLVDTPATLPAAALGALHAVTGLAGGIGAIAAIALFAGRTGEPGPVTRAIAALGQRSLTFYIFQSIVFLAVFAPFTTGLGARTGFIGAAAVAVATWLLSLALAEAMRRRGHRGPAERLLRRLTYGPPANVAKAPDSKPRSWEPEDTDHRRRA